MPEKAATEQLDIKGTRQGLMIRLPAKMAFEDLKADLEARMAASGDFFKGASFSFQYEKECLSGNQVLELESICRSFGLLPHGQTREQKAPASAPRARINHYPRALKEEDMDDCLLLFKTFRSGQQVSYRGNLTILGDVHPGAEVAAGRSIVIMGTLAGTALAGLSGDATATVLACRLLPARLSLAGVGLETEKLAPSPQPRLAFLRQGRVEVREWLT